MITFPYLLTESDIDEIFEQLGNEIWRSLKNTARPDCLYIPYGWGWCIDGDYRRSLPK